MGETRKLVSPARVFARPTADQVWLGAPQRAALSHLSRPAPVRVITGPASSGKTTLLNYVVAQRYANAVVLQSRGAKDEAASILGSLLLSADLAPWDLSEIEQRNLLSVFIQQRRSQGRRVAVLIDDAHMVKGGALEEIERLVAIRVDKKPAVELWIAGNPSITRRWCEAQERLGVAELLVHAIEAASQDDLAAYLDWRLGRFEMQAVVTATAVKMIARLSGGRYAAADVLCQMSLLLMRQQDTDRVDARVVRQAVSRLVARQASKLEGKRARDADLGLPAPANGYVIVSRAGKTLTRSTLAQRTLIGRSEHNDICLASPYLGRHHAAIVDTPEGFYLIDLNSVNGILLNGRKIERSVLCDEDVLTMGPFRLKLQLPEWLPESGPATDAETLVDTAIMPRPSAESSSIRRIK